MSDKKIERKFFQREMSDYYVYKELSKNEKHPKLKALLKELSNTEDRHMHSWQKFAGMEDVDTSKKTFVISLRVFGYKIARMLGIAFAIKLLERNETDGLESYERALRQGKGSKTERSYIKAVINDEKNHEDVLAKHTEENQGNLEYIRSIVFGLNDGLVEVLAAVVGFAVIASSGGIVVIGGIIVGISGTLSMAGGAYLASKSDVIVEQSLSKGIGRKQTAPGRDALLTGVYYFLGAVVSILPFALGLSGPTGIIASIVSVMVVLTIASIIIAIVSDTSIKRRMFEMIGISLGAAFVTILLGFMLKTYFGVTI